MELYQDAVGEPFNYIRTTDRGKAFIKHLLTQKLPEKKVIWEVPNA